MANSPIEQLGHRLIKGRPWEQIAGFWLEALPSIDPPGGPPDTSIRELLELLGIKNEVMSGDAHENVQGLREALLREAIFLLHKASHVLSCAEVMHIQGRRTWALSDGYHAALFAARAILGLLGIGATDFGGPSVVFNVWPIAEKEKMARNSQRASTPPLTTLFMPYRTRLDHSHVWSLFSRALRVIVLPAWAAPIVKKIKALDDSRLSHQRNRLHYSNHTWIGDDLHSLNPPDAAEIEAFDLEGVLDSEAREQFSLALGLSIYLLGANLMGSIQSRLLDGERALLDEKLACGWYPFTNLLRERFRVDR